MSHEISMIGSRGVPGHRGGVERVVEAVAPRLAARGNHVRVHCANWSEYKASEWKGVRLERTQGLRHKYFDTLSRSFVASLKEVAKPGRAVIHYHGSGSAPLAWLPRIFGKKVVVTVHGLDWGRSKWNVFGRWFLQFGEWAACRLPHRTIVVSQELKRVLDAKYGIDAVYIPNGVEDRTHRAADKISRKWGLESRNCVLFLARLVPEKAAHVLLDAFLSLKDTKGFKLVIAGPAWFSKEYSEELVKRAAGRPDVIFTGEVDEDELAELYSNCHLYVLPSEVEGMSLSLLDGMAFSACIISSDIAANADVVRGAGTTFKTGDVKDLAEKLRAFIERPQDAESYRKLAREKMTQEFHWDKIAERWESFYDELCDNGSGGGAALTRNDSAIIGSWTSESSRHSSPQATSPKPLRPSPAI